MNADTEQLRNKIFGIRDDKDLLEVSLDVFRHQATNCAIYKEFVSRLGVEVSSVNKLTDIPFLPISFFKSHEVISHDQEAQIRFTSSGTTGENTSTHLVADKSIYEESFLKTFIQFYGDPSSYCILGLLPGYLERSGSSLIYMVDDLIKRSNNADSGFYLYDHEKLENVLLRLHSLQKPVMLIGVSFALLDFFEPRIMDLKYTTIIETGGMKGRKKELIREELHAILKKHSGVSSIHSEYGMTELLSQAYSKEDGIYNCPPWMKILIRDTSDPLSYVTNGKTGGINVIDLANIHSCSFIATQDLGRVIDNNFIEVLGRFDNSDVRGCSLMV